MMFRPTTGRGLLTAAVLSLGASPAPAELVVAVVAPLKSDGAYVDVGNQMRAAAEQAVADINVQRATLNAAGAGRKLDLLVLQLADDECDKARGQTIANQLANQGVPLVVGHFCSWVSVPAGEAYRSEKTLQIAPFSSMPASSSSPTLFRLTGSISSQVKSFVDWLRDVTAKVPEPPNPVNIAVATDATPYGDEIESEVIQQLKDAGIDVNAPTRPTYNAKAFKIPSEAPTQTVDVTDTANQIVNWGADIVFLGGYHTEMKPLSGALAIRVPEIKLFASDANVIGAFSGGSEDRLAFIYGEDPLPDQCNGGANPSNCALAGRIEARLGHGKKIEPSAFFTYAAIELWAKAEASQAAPDPWAVPLTLEGQDFSTVLGTVGFQNGNTTHQNFYFYQWVASTLRPLQP